MTEDNEKRAKTGLCEEEENNEKPGEKLWTNEEENEEYVEAACLYVWRE